MNRRSFVQTAAAALASGPGPALGADRKTNVLFVLADQWRFSAFSGIGNDPLGHTPNFEKLAGQGAHWQRCYAANPVCTPNRSCILTGRYSHQHGMTHNNIMLPPENRCIAQVFAEAGYATHYIGKWHMDGEPRPGFVPPSWRRRGFQTFEGFNRGHFYPTGAQYFTNDGKLLHPDIYEPHYQTDLAIQFMRRNQDKPFYCYLSWGPPHMPYKPPPEWKKYAPNKLEWRPNVPQAERDNLTTRNELAGYYGLCESIDFEMSRLYQALDEMNLASNTLLVFTSDHGDMHGSHGLHYKSKPEEESLHIPLFMRLPGRIKGGQKPSTLVSSIDLTPTILSICGLKAPSTVTGRDVSGAVLGGPEPKVESVFAEGAMRAHPVANAKADPEEAGAPGEWRALVTPTHKLIRRLGDEVSQIYDLEKDPYEMKNLANQKSTAVLQKHLSEQMRKWAKDTGDPFPAISPAAKAMYSDEEAGRR